MVNIYETRVEANGKSYIAKLMEMTDENQCREIVFANGEQIHYAEFPASNLGDAKRSGYLKVMAESIAYRHKREIA
jgi:hypothetical protein